MASHHQHRDESASDWLLRIAPLAKRLNEESLGDCPLDPSTEGTGGANNASGRNS